MMTDPKQIKARREARRVERENRRADHVRGENQKSIDEIDGAFVAEALGAIKDIDLIVISLLKDYLRRGLRMSPLLREYHSKMVEGHILEPGEEREAVLEMLAGAVGLLPRSGKAFVYGGILERRDVFLGFAEGPGQWEKVQGMLDQALGRGVHAFKV